MNHSLRKFRTHAGIIIIVLLLGVLDAPVYAQANPEIANCEEVQDEATLTQMEFCSAHIGCNMVLKLQKACVKAKGFLNNLRDALAGRKEITNNDVFEANSPTLTSSEALITKVSAVQKIVRGAPDESSKGKLDQTSSGGTRVYYEGGIKDGSYHGIGAYINENGAMGRGQMNNGRIEGQAQTVTTNSTIIVGDFVNSVPNGDIAYQSSNGAVLSGTYLSNKWSGLRETTTRDGSHYKELFSADGKLLARGPVATAGQLAQAPSAPEPTAAERVTKSYDQRISVARAQCTSGENSCQKGCSAVATVGLLAVLAGKGNGAGEASEQIQQCTKRCDSDKSSCDQQVKSLEREKSQAIAEATALPKPSSNTSSGSGTTAVSASASLTCDGQCLLLVAEAKCKPMKYSGAEQIGCLIQNGLGRGGDTPEICAQAKSLTGCMTKAEKLAAKSSSTTTAPKKYKYGSVCERNYEKIQDVVREKNIMMAGATYDLFLKDIQWNWAKIFESCIGSSAEAARGYKASMEEYNKISRYCAGAHNQRLECTQWGASGGISDNGGNPFNNPAWYAGFKAEVDKALFDPNYSADLGTVTGSDTVNAADAACAVSLQTIDNQYAAAQGNIPKDSVVVLSEANMWKIAASIEKIKTQCPQSERYKAETATIQSQYQELKRVCDATASRTCAPRLPGKEPAPAPQAATALPPLQGKLPASCESQSGANWKKCMQEACAKLEGKFSGSSCVSCYWAGGGWNRCPPGSGGVSSDQ